MNLSEITVGVNSEQSFFDRIHPWFKIEREDVKLYGWHGAIVLATIRYWFTPHEDGTTRLRVWKHGVPWLVRTYQQLAEEAELSPKQVYNAIQLLKKRGVIETCVHRFAKIPNLHIRFLPTKIPEENQGREKSPTISTFFPPGEVSDLAARENHLHQKPVTRSLVASSITVSSRSDEKNPLTPQSGVESLHSRAGEQRQERKEQVNPIGPIVQTIVEKARQNAKQVIREQPQASAQSRETPPSQTDWESSDSWAPSSRSSSGGAPRTIAKGTNTRATGNNPRALGTNPRAIAKRQEQDRREGAAIIDKLNRLREENEVRVRIGEPPVTLDTPQSAARVWLLQEAGVDLWKADRIVWGR